MTSMNIIWPFAGMVGWYILLLDWRKEFNSTYGYCPSPYSLILLIPCLACGVILLIASILIWILDAADHITADSWWTQPICGKGGPLR